MNKRDRNPYHMKLKIQWQEIDNGGKKIEVLPCHQKTQNVNYGEWDWKWREVTILERMTKRHHIVIIVFKLNISGSEKVYRQISEISEVWEWKG